MKAPSADREYHVIEFDEAREAAAFLAALARFLDSPRGSSFMTHADSVEAWSYSRVKHGVVDLYLSDRALDAANAAFAPVSVARKRHGHAIPSDCVLMIGGVHAPPSKLADAERRLKDEGVV